MQEIVAQKKCDNIKNDGQINLSTFRLYVLTFIHFTYSINISEIQISIVLNKV